MSNDDVVVSPVLIVGAGPTGLVLALWLTRLGVRVRIIDKASQPGTTSRALAVQARTLEFYQQIGIVDEVIRGGVKIPHLAFWVRGARAAQVPLARIGSGLTPYPFALVFPQDAHEQLLIERLASLGVQVERETVLVELTQRDQVVQVKLRAGNGAEEICDVGYVAGCDGASSTVRAQLGIGFPGGTYTGLFYVADVEGSGAGSDNDLNVDLEDADFLLVFPLREKGHFRLVGNVRDGSADDRREISFDDVRGKAVEHLKLTINKVNWFSTYRVHHRVANRFQDRRVFLLGDAAHVHSPVGGQGMNTGIGDAVNLAWKLAAVLRNGAGTDLLATYEPERIAFARRLVATTDRAFTVVTKRGTLARIIRMRLAPLLAPWLFRIPRLRRFMFETLSQIRVAYRDSSLSVGAAGGVHAGDRLPWVELGAQHDNFAALTSLEWQVHIYGEARPGLDDVCAHYGVALNVFPWRSAMRAAGLLRDAIYLVRPDGHVGLADAPADAARLREYCEKVIKQSPASIQIQTPQAP